MPFKTVDNTLSTVDENRGVTIRSSRTFRDTTTPWFTYIDEFMEFDFAAGQGAKSPGDSMPDKSGSSEKVTCHIFEETVKKGLNKALKGAGREFSESEYELLKITLADGIYSLNTMDGHFLTGGRIYEVDFI